MIVDVHLSVILHLFPFASPLLGEPRCDEFTPLVRGDVALKPKRQWRQACSWILLQVVKDIEL